MLIIVEIGIGKAQLWCFGINHVNKKYQKNHVTTYRKGKKMSIVVWSAIFNNGMPRIVQMKLELRSAKKGYSKESYLEVLQTSLVTLNS